MFRNQYDNEVTIFSPDGRIYQIEYAGEAVKQGAATVALKNSELAVLAASKRQQDELAEHQKKTFQLDSHVGMGVAGMLPDALLLTKFMRMECLDSMWAYDEPLPIRRLVRSVCEKLQIATQRYGRRPFGVGLLVVGYDQEGPHIVNIQPSAKSLELIAHSIGNRAQSAKTYFQKYKDQFKTCSKDELIVHALTALKSTLQKDSDDKEKFPKSIELAIVGKDQPFTLLTDDQIKFYLEKVEAAAATVPPAQEEETMEQH